MASTSGSAEISSLWIGWAMLFGICVAGLSVYHVTYPAVDLKASEITAVRLEDEVVTGSFRIQNTSWLDVKDPVISCEMKARSGNVANTVSKTIYEVIPAGKAIEVFPMSVGFAVDEAIEFTCKISGASVKW